jgi:TPP-dependent 2-oxoacid decarboxylase
MIKGIIDRFEDDYVVVEIEGTTKDYLKAHFPKEAKPGDVVYIEGNNIRIDKHETKKLEDEIQKLMDEVWED